MHHLVWLLRQSRPRPVLRTGYKTCAKSIAFDVSADSGEISGTFKRLRMESTLIDRSLPNGLMATMPADCMGSSYPLHELDQGYCVRRFHHKVPVVRENAVRDEP